MQVISGRKIWENGEFLGHVNTPYNYPCDRITNSTPRLGWLIPTQGCCGNPTYYTLTLDDPKRTDAIAGVWIEFDGNGILIDAESVDDVVNKCNGCCGDAAKIESRYDGNYPQIDVTVEQLATYQITRTDNGSALDEQSARLAYLGEYKEGTFSKISRDDVAGKTVYQFKAYKDPRPKGSDIISNETDRTFELPQPAALPEGFNAYELTVVADGVELPKVSADTLAHLIPAIAAVDALASLGTWQLYNGTTLQLITKKVTEALLSIEPIVVAAP